MWAALSGLILSFYGICIPAAAQTPAFPTAEGFGMWATGGRGGQVVEVTNLEDDANGTIPGSLRWALKQYPNDPLTIVFRVSGVIELVTQLRSSRTKGTTIAGQTAPGDGICIRGAKCNFGGSKNLIIRHLRFRIGLKELGGGATEFIEGGSIGIENGSNWIIDHCTFGWSGEENMTIYDNTLTTVQWCIVHEGLYDAGHGKGLRSYGSQWGGQSASYHHNLLANNYNRSPRFNGARSNDINVLLDFVNNVNFNWGKANSTYGGDIDAKGKTHRCNMINNYYKPGPARPGTSSSFFVQSSFHAEQTTSKIAQWHMSGNFMEGSANAALNQDNYLGLDASAYTGRSIDKSALIAAQPFEVPYQLRIESAQEAYESVLAGAGAFPRDTVDRRILREVRTGVPTFGGSFGAGKGIIDQPSNVGGYPVYETFDTIPDADHDGMDDTWETENGLNPTDPDDRNRIVNAGYTCLEVYLNSLVGEEIALDFNIRARKVHDYVVALDGSGDFTSINQALDSAAEDGTRTTIFIKNGTYREKVFIGNRYQSSGKIISLIGEAVDSVIIIWDDYQGKEITYPGRSGTITADGTTCPTMTVTAPDFYMENITVINPSTAAQAVALYQTGDRQVLKNCKILGHQDTHRTKKGARFFYFQCTIEGGVDFIYAGGTCYFYQCQIVSNRGGYITAPEDVPYKATLASGKTLRYGFFFRDCDVVAKDGVGPSTVYLGRPWQPECGSVFMESRLGDHIHPKGWTTFGAGNEQTACFAEFHNTNASGSAPVDASQRIDWSQQVTTEDVNKLMLLSKIYRAVSNARFDPVPQVIAPDAPKWLKVTGDYLNWEPVDSVLGYVIYADGAIIGFNHLAHFVDTATYETPPVYTIKSVGLLGNLSVGHGGQESFTAESINKVIDTPIATTGINEVLPDAGYLPRIVDGRVLFEQPVDCQVFSVLGQTIVLEKNICSFDMQRLQSGIYFFLIQDSSKRLFSFKVSHIQ